MNKELYEATFNCWSSAWAMYRRWLSMTENWKVAAETAKRDSRRFSITHEKVKGLADGIIHLLVYEMDVLCRSHDGNKPVTDEEIKPYYTIWNDAWKTFRKWIVNKCDKDTVDVEHKDFCSRWSKEGYPRFASMALAELVTEWKVGDGS